MAGNPDRISDEAARAIWRRAAQLQAEAERRSEERQLLPPSIGKSASDAEGLHLDDVRAAGEDAGISPEFVQIALAEASAAGEVSAAVSPVDVLGARLFLGASRRTLEMMVTVQGRVDVVAAAVLQVFSGHPCLLQAGEVAELSSSAGRVIVFNVPKFDWSATANPPFVEKAAAIGLRQLHIAVRPSPEDADSCEATVAGDLHPGMRRYWRWSAATSVGATAVGGAAGVGLAATAVAGPLLILPAIVGAAVISGASVGAWALGYRYYRATVEESLQASLQLLPAAVRAITANRGRALP